MLTQEQSDKLDHDYYRRNANPLITEARKNMIAEAFLLFEEEGEIIETDLAENVANSMELHLDDETAAIPECLFDMAIHVAKQVMREVEK